MDKEVYKIVFDLNSDVGDDLNKVNTDLGRISSINRNQARNSKLDTLATISAFSSAMSRQKTKTVVQEKVIERVRTEVKVKEVIKEKAPANMVSYSEFQMALNDRSRLAQALEANKENIKLGKQYPKLLNSYKIMQERYQANIKIIQFQANEIKKLQQINKLHAAQGNMLYPTLPGLTNLSTVANPKKAGMKSTDNPLNTDVPWEINIHDLVRFKQANMG